MTPRSIKRCHPARRDDIGDLTTRRPVPSADLPHLDPFLFLNHHGPQVYPPHNRGLPFGPHPHRGFETVTFILEGSLAHHDTGGHESVITAGGVQWMTAGRGLVHSELSPAAFLAEGGPLEILQLWVNLPARLKMTEPRYIGCQRDEIASVSTDDGRVVIQAVAGDWFGQPGAITPLTDIRIGTVTLAPGGRLELAIAPGRAVFLYLVRGALQIGDQPVKPWNLVELTDGDHLSLAAMTEEAVIILGDAAPYGEPVVAYGPFVMNSEAEITQAIRDYQNGRLR